MDEPQVTDDAYPALSKLQSQLEVLDGSTTTITVDVDVSEARQKLEDLLAHIASEITAVLDKFWAPDATDEQRATAAEQFYALDDKRKKLQAQLDALPAAPDSTPSTPSSSVDNDMLNKTISQLNTLLSNTNTLMKNLTDALGGNGPLAFNIGQLNASLQTNTASLNTLIVLMQGNPTFLGTRG